MMNKVKWISFKDKLPEDGKKILISDGEMINIAQMVIEKTVFGFTSDIHLVALNGGWDLDDLTHWAELPELPK